MADLSQTPANVGVGLASVPTRIVQYGEAVTQGMPVYQSTDNKWYQTDASAAATAQCDGIALTPGSTDGYGVVVLPSVTGGRSLVNLGATLTVGEVYALSATKGAIAPVGDLTSTEYITTIGHARSSSLLDFQVVESYTARA